jgi:hypothetical protein
MKRLLSLCALLCLGISGCTYTVAVSQSNIPAQRSKPVEASVYKFIVFALTFDNDYALQLGSKLKERCPQGSVRGVTTQDTVTFYVPGIFWAREINARGYCMPSKTTASLEPELGEIASSQE